MLRVAVPRFAKTLLSSPALSDSLVSTFHQTARILGCRGIKNPDLMAIDRIVSKAAGKKNAVYGAALLGRAQAVINFEKPSEALADLQAAIETLQPLAASDAASSNLLRMAKALRLRAHNDVLDALEASMSVAGTANEQNVSTLRSTVKAEYIALCKENPTCIFARLAKAEFLLYEGLVEQAEQSLAIIDDLLAKAASAVAAAPAASASELQKLAYVLTRDAGTVGTSAKYLDGAQAQSDALKAFAANVAKDASLSNEEAAELVILYANAETGHHFHDFFPLHDHYKSHTSEAAHALEAKIRFFDNPKTVASVTAEQLQAVAAKGTDTRYGSAVDIAALVKASTSKDIVGELLGAFGTPLTTERNAFGQALATIQAQPVQPTDVQRTQEADAFVSDLLQQIGFRAKVARALILEKLKRPAEALALLDDVVHADKFIFMWRAYLSRGRIRQHFGKVDEADSDFKQLFSSKKPFVNADIPRRDENRQKSAF